MIRAPRPRVVAHQLERGSVGKDRLEPIAAVPRFALDAVRARARLAREGALVVDALAKT